VFHTSITNPLVLRKHILKPKEKLLQAISINKLLYLHLKIFANLSTANAPFFFPFIKKFESAIVQQLSKESFHQFFSTPVLIFPLHLPTFFTKLKVDA
jgi:hypothetical protein